MHPLVIPLLVFGAVAVIWMISYLFSRQVVVRRRLGKVESQPIGSFQNGQVGRITGRIVFAGDVMRAPLSGRECVYYYVEVEEHQGRSRGKIITDEMTSTVVLYDGSHYALVNTAHIKSHLIPDASYESGTFNDATPTLEAFLGKHGKDSTNFLGLNRTLYYREGVLEKDELVTVLGQGMWEKAEKYKLNLQGQMVLVIRPNGKESVFLSDDPAATR